MHKLLIGISLLAVAPQVAGANTAFQTAKVERIAPEKLRGEVAYIQSRDVWCINPRTLQKHLLFKNLFYPAKASLTPHGVTFVFDYQGIAWSPDRSRIAYIYTTPEMDGTQLWEMRWDGSERQLLAEGDGISNPQWSPDGTMLVFDRHSTRTDVGFGYVSYGIVGRDAKLVNLPEPKTADANSTDYASIYHPRWSRDGQRILLDYSPNSADYIGECPPIKNKVLSLKTLTYSDLPDSELPEFASPRTRSDSHFDTNTGLYIRRVISGAGKDESVFSADWTRGYIKPNGEFYTKFSRDIWFESPSLRTSPEAFAFRRIVRDAELVDWL